MWVFFFNTLQVWDINWFFFSVFTLFGEDSCALTWWKRRTTGSINRAVTLSLSLSLCAGAAASIGGLFKLWESPEKYSSSPPPAPVADRSPGPTNSLRSFRHGTETVSFQPENRSSVAVWHFLDWKAVVPKLPVFLPSRIPCRPLEAGCPKSSHELLWIQ